MVQIKRLMMFSLKMLDYPMSFLSLSTWTLTPSQHSVVIWTMYSHPDPLKVIGWMAQLATPMFSLSLSTWTWDTFLTPGGSQGFYRDHVLPPRPSKSYRVDGTAGFIVAQPAIWWHSRLYGGWHSRLYTGTAGYMVVAHKILVSAQGPLVLVLRLRVWG